MSGEPAAASGEMPDAAAGVALVDGYNLAFRAYYGMPGLTRKDGFPTGALHGWVRSLWWVEDNLKPGRVIAFFDLGGARRQLALREDYKATRSETPEDLQRQMPVIKAWTRAAGYGGWERDGVEADDLIATYARHFAGQGQRVQIISADKDMAQMVSEHIEQWTPPPTANPKAGWRRLDPAAVVDKFGVQPGQIADYLALIGDTADNIPGLPGVGPKTAAAWLQRYGNLDGILAHSGELQPKRFQAVVHASAQQLRLNRQMTTLDACQELFAEDELPPVDPAAALAILEEMEMESTARKLGQRQPA